MNRVRVKSSQEQVVKILPARTKRVEPEIFAQRIGAELLGDAPAGSPVVRRARRM
jgi:hypothetical protein